MCEAQEKTIDQPEVWPLPQSAHSIQRKEKMQIEFYQELINFNLSHTNTSFLRLNNFFCVPVAFWSRIHNYNLGGRTPFINWKHKRASENSLSMYSGQNQSNSINILCGSLWAQKNVEKLNIVKYRAWNMNVHQGICWTKWRRDI